MKEQFEKYSPKWLLHRILEAGDKHGEALMYILEFQRELIKNCNIPHVSNRRELLSNFANWFNNYYDFDFTVDDSDIEEFLKIAL